MAENPGPDRPCPRGSHMSFGVPLLEECLWDLPYDPSPGMNELQVPIAHVTSPVLISRLHVLRQIWPRNDVASQVGDADSIAIFREGQPDLRYLQDSMARLWSAWSRPSTATKMLLSACPLLDRLEHSWSNESFSR